ncbi:pyridoxal phosphate-dependent aminotransferase [Clostridium grantii]|uniref:Aminotransferase n=1 Tax=Clostridium grantii DSM 8605 TaxID=1121316 RepID=A0A1M5VU13_9CLOT|nr:aminotransferase class I/II-fold pyridoxal phosphate-dependent enzyme [Clostridium grantii]SHH78762.1 aminotransferase [Clostridium grantii DSM 8605]
MSDFSSKNVNNIEISGIRKFYNKVCQVPGAISLTLGQPDFPVPLTIKEAIIKAINEDKTTYTSNAGLLELREEISTYLKNEFSINYEADEICTTIGGSEALLSTFTALINSGDKVLIPTPAYPAYESSVKLLGGEVINYELKEDFTLNLEELKILIKEEKPKILVLSFPTNPTGALLSKENKDNLVQLIKEEEIIVISDEIYSALCYSDEYYSVAQSEEIKNKVILVSGFSKMFSMTGLRLGYVCATESIMKHIIKVHQYNVSCAPSIVQYGAYEGLKNAMEDVCFMKKEFQKRRDYVYGRLIEMGIDVVEPLGAFYIFPSIKKFNLSSDEFCHRLLFEKKLAIVPGSAFGVGGEGYIRISYCYSMKQLVLALDKLEEFLKELVILKH